MPEALRSIIGAACAVFFLVASPAGFPATAEAAACNAVNADVHAEVNTSGVAVS